MFKDKLVSSLEEIKSIHERTTAGVVLSSNSLTNSCTVEMMDYNGRRTVLSNVRVRTPAKGFVGFLPSKGDLVEINMINGVYQIGSVSSTSFSRQKEETRLKADILPNRMIDSINGFII